MGRQPDRRGSRPRTHEAPIDPDAPAPEARQAGQIAFGQKGADTGGTRRAADEFVQSIGPGFALDHLCDGPLAPRKGSQ